MAGSVQIGTSHLDLQRGLLIRNGHAVRLQPKPYQLLVCLARSRGAIIPKEALLEAMWPGVTVLEDSLTQAVRLLRRGLGPDADMVRTVNRRGYMLAECGTETLVPASPDLFGPRIAVLPLAWPANSPEFEELAVRLTDELAALLARFGHLSLVNPRSVAEAMTLTGQTKAAARAVGAAYVVDGSLSVAGAGLALVVRLGTVGADRQIWGETLLLPASNVRDSMARVAMAVAGQLQLVRESVAEQATRTNRTPATAESLSTRAFVHLRSYDPQANDEAFALFDTALDLDPAHARAQAGMAMARMASRNFCGSDPEALFLARQAVRLAPHDSLCLRALGLAEACAGEGAAAEASLLRAIDLNPADADTMSILGFVMTCRGKAAEALEWFDRAYSINPAPPDWYRQDHACALLALDRFDEVIALLRLIPNLREYGEMRYAACLAQRGEVAECCRHLALAREKLGSADLLARVDSLTYYDDPAAKQHFRDQVAFALALEARALDRQLPQLGLSGPVANESPDPDHPEPIRRPVFRVGKHVSETTIRPWTMQPGFGKGSKSDMPGKPSGQWLRPP